MGKFEAGQVYSFDYPFVREELEPWDDKTVLGLWRPGVQREQDECGHMAPPYADGIGRQVINIISVHKPGKYLPRVFYLRSWIDPDGKEFGSTIVKVRTAQSLGKIIRGYGYKYILHGETK